jgi:hypothetical protein
MASSHEANTYERFNDQIIQNIPQTTKLNSVPEHIHKLKNII